MFNLEEGKKRSLTVQINGYIAVIVRVIRQRNLFYILNAGIVFVSVVTVQENIQIALKILRRSIKSVYRSYSKNQETSHILN